MLTWRAVVRRSARLNYRNKTNCKRLSSFVGGGQPAAKSSGTVEAHAAGLQMGKAGLMRRHSWRRGTAGFARSSNGWLERGIVRASIRLGFVLAAAGLVAGCFEPLYGRNPSLGDESIRDKLAEVMIAPIPMRQGTPQARIAVALRNALQFDLNGAAGAAAPTHRLDVLVATTDLTLAIDPVSGRPTEEIGGVTATYQLVEIATGKIALKDSTFANAGYDIPGSQQRFAKQRAQIDAQDRAANLAAEAIRNRLASYFVAGT
jgi:LPS-assembly lipoprotein